MASTQRTEVSWRNLDEFSGPPQERMDYYTYAYLREDRTPYYIGKGRGSRMHSRWRRIKPPKDKSRIIYLKQNLTEEEAFRHEIYMIDVFGRKDLGTGILRNRTNGGEGTSGVIFSEATRRKMSESRKGNTNSLGYKHSEETRKRMSESRIGNTNCSGILASEETKRKMSEARKGKTASEETKRKMSEIRKGKRSPNFGKKWWNDGCGNRKLALEYPGDSWKVGMK